LIYPNPAKDRVIVNSLNVLKQIEIYDLSGKKILSRKPDSEITFSISKNQLNSGFYIMKIIDSKENSYIRKLVFE